MSTEWATRLANEFDWAEAEPSPEDVVEEAEEHRIDSVDSLINHMRDAPENCSTGYLKWKWCRNHMSAFGF